MANMNELPHSEFIIVAETNCLLEMAEQLAQRRVDVTVLGLVGGAPGGETPRVADSSAAGAKRASVATY